MRDRRERLAPASVARPDNRSRLSALDESHVLGEPYKLISAANATLVLEDRFGDRREYTDLMSAYGAVNFGHCNPEIRPFDDLEMDIAAGCATHAAEFFAGWLCGELDRPASRVLFQVGGSFAVSTALALAQRARPGRIAVVRGSFHGLGLDALAATTVGHESALQHSQLLEPLRGQFAVLDPGDDEGPADWDSYSAFLFEPIQGANGYVPLPAAWLRRIAGEARSAGVAVIADEIQAGFFRHGMLSPTSAAGIEADMCLYSKSMTNGLYPASVVVYDKRFEESVANAPLLAHTFQTSALGAAAAAAVAEYVTRTDVSGMASRVEAVLDSAADALCAVAGVENLFVTGPTLSFAVGEGRSATIVRRCVERGVLPFTGGQHADRVRIAPPLTIPDAQLRHALEVVGECIEATQGLAPVGV